MAKRIGIITILKVNNYGAELQAFATQRKMNLMGYDAEIIDYLFYKNPQAKSEKASRPFYSFPLKKRVKEILLPIVSKIKSLRNRKANEQRQARFADFHKRNTKFSSQTYHCLTELYANPPHYDAYCVGSDQVWNPGCYTNLDPYFLTFAPKDAKKFSYASSFGVSQIPQDAQARYAENLGRLHHIGVRETTGRNIVKELTQKEAEVVLDPTLLLSADEWREVARYEKAPQKPYLLIYELQDSPRLNQEALRIAKEKGLQIVRICKEAYRQDPENSAIANILDAAPDDFLGLIDRAAFVVTNSFHGTVFSIIFNKQFTCVLKRGFERNSRQINLLEAVGLQDCLLYHDSERQDTKVIDYSEVNSKLCILRNKSVDYIKKAIDEQ